jgi:hypothetical protein
MTKFRYQLAALVSASLLAACGGGGGSAVVAPTGNIAAAGLISGIGSIVLNGVRYETLGASTLDYDDDSAFTAPLGMGMVVSVTAAAGTPTIANTIYVQSGINGQTANVNSVNNTLTIAGLPVTLSTSTVVVTATGAVGTLANVTDGLQVETYGLPQADGSFKATRLEIKAVPETVQLLGAVRNLNTSNQTFTLGSGSQTVTITYSGVTPPTGLVDGVVVSVRTNATTTSTQYTPTALYLHTTDVAVFQTYESEYRGTSSVSNETNELYGVVSNLATNGSGCDLQVQGIPTTLTSSTLCAAIQDGDYVEVKGIFANGALTGHRVEFKTAATDRTLSGYIDDDSDSDNDGVKYRRQYHSDSASSSSDDGVYRSDNNGATFEIYGTLACSASLCTLTSSGTTLNADISTARWEHGQVSSGFVEAKGYMSSATTFKVTKIESKR